METLSFARYEGISTEATLSLRSIWGISTMRTPSLRSIWADIDDEDSVPALDMGDIDVEDFFPLLDIGAYRRRGLCPFARYGGISTTATLSLFAVQLTPAAATESPPRAVVVLAPGGRVLFFSDTVFDRLYAAEALPPGGSLVSQNRANGG